jgi:hypothetical protein
LKIGLNRKHLLDRVRQAASSPTATSIPDPPLLSHALSRAPTPLFPLYFDRPTAKCPLGYFSSARLFLRVLELTQDPSPSPLTICPSSAAGAHSLSPNLDQMLLPPPSSVSATIRVFSHRFPWPSSSLDTLELQEHIGATANLRITAATHQR